MDCTQAQRDGTAQFPDLHLFAADQAPRQAVLPQFNPLFPTIFHERWWLDICSNGAVQHACVERDGVPIALMPYMMTRRLGIRFCRLPPLVHFSGPSFAALDGPPQSQTQRRNDLTEELLSQIPPSDVTALKLYHGITDTLAFQREGFKTQVQFTYEIMPQPAEVMLRNIRRGHRRMIRDADALYTVDTEAAPSEFVACYRDNIRNTGRRFKYDTDLLIRLIAACLKRGQGQILLARDVVGNATAGLFVMWDHHRMYNFMATKGATDSSASVLLTWSAIQEAAKRQLIFDFDGVFNVGQIQYFAGFGGLVTPRYIVLRTSRRADLALTVYGLTQPKKQFF